MAQKLVCIELAGFAGVSTEYAISDLGNDAYEVLDLIAGRDGTDTVQNIDLLRFSDGDFDPASPIFSSQGNASPSLAPTEEGAFSPQDWTYGHLVLEPVYLEWHVV